MKPQAHRDTRLQILDAARQVIVAKGFHAVGLNEILTASGTPKGSFYHWFQSKEHFGQALLERHFEIYLREVDGFLVHGQGSARDRLLAFFENWRQTQSSADANLRCPVVKLGAEVCDLSEVMRTSLERGTAQVLTRIAGCISEGIGAGEFGIDVDAKDAAQRLYQQWIGATLVARIFKNSESLDAALEQTRRWLDHQVRLPRSPAAGL